MPAVAGYPMLVRSVVVHNVRMTNVVVPTVVMRIMVVRTPVVRAVVKVAVVRGVLSTSVIHRHENTPWGYTTGEGIRYSRSVPPARRNVRIEQ